MVEHSIICIFNSHSTSVSGAQVTALVRDLSRLPEDVAPKIKVVHGNSTVKEDVVKALEGQDAVIVALGTRHDLSKNTS